MSSLKLHCVHEFLGIALHHFILLETLTKNCCVLIFSAEYHVSFLSCDFYPRAVVYCANVFNRRYVYVFHFVSVII